jgi:glucosamine--fructose-6-phosphate aminotransferase (isomerizing)
VVANLISSHFDGDLKQAVEAAVGELEGMYAIAVMTTESDEREIVAACQGPPLVLGLGEGEQFLASDPAALLAYTRDVMFLEDGDVARLRAGSIEIWHGTEIVDPDVHRLDWDPVQAEKGGYKHFMLKEIHEQPQAVQDTIAGRVDFEEGTVGVDTLQLEPEKLAAIERLQLLACGTSWHAALVGKFMLEELTGMPVDVDYGSEYRYRNPIVGPTVLALGISQSGETADTVSALRAAREQGAPVVSICNVLGSQITRLSDGVIYTHAGPEIGVASTKAFTTQLVAIYLFALWLRQELGMGVERWMLDDLAHLPAAVDQAVKSEPDVERLARKYFRADDFLFLGRGINYPIALEGALKLKEISYIHAEGYPAGEMKHGPIALIDEDLPVVGVATGDRVFEKVLGNLQEVKARDGVVLALADRDSAGLYFIGVRRGCDVDQPRNLAKSVTVE